MPYITYTHSHRAFFIFFLRLNHGLSLCCILFYLCYARFSTTIISPNISHVFHHDLLCIVLPAFCMLELFEVIHAFQWTSVWARLERVRSRIKAK